MSLVVRVFHFETITSGLNILIGSDLITTNVDISFNLSFLESNVNYRCGEKWLARTVALLLRIQ